MKKVLVLTLVCIAFVVHAQSDVEAIKKVVTVAYIEGTQNLGSIDDIRKGFHPSFTMLRLLENNVSPLSLEDWIKAIETRRKENAGNLVRTEGKILTVDVMGRAATVKLELHKEGKLIFIDYLALYKFLEGWRIVSKTFYRHP
ncbi:MAG: nuclear transport factor 2 family protein [Cyclobacteriaceae bacterium]|nr:nuclear transport factor 2 family protein [Cyclobacteriaceae bacterium]UYN86982.1 MAG: nuclear transport factor 2 family protein [Cyclobacteriaceae bacterium]